VLANYATSQWLKVDLCPQNIVHLFQSSTFGQPTLQRGLSAVAELLVFNRASWDLQKIDNNFCNYTLPGSRTGSGGLCLGDYSVLGARAGFRVLIRGGEGIEAKGSEEGK